MDNRKKKSLEQNRIQVTFIFLAICLIRTTPWGRYYYYRLNKDVVNNKPKATKQWEDLVLAQKSKIDTAGGECWEKKSTLNNDNYVYRTEYTL